MKIEDIEYNYKTIIDLAVVGSIIIGMDGKILDLNEHAEEIIGYNKNEFMGKSSNLLFIDINELIQIFDHLRSNDTLKKYKMKIKRKNGDIGYTLHNINNINDDEGNIIGFQSFFIDITKENLLEQIFSIFLNDIEEKNLKLVKQNLNIDKFIVNLIDLLDPYKKFLKNLEQEYFGSA